MSNMTKGLKNCLIENCLITGGAGFIGSHLTERLLKEGCRVTVVDDLSEGKWENLPKHPKLIKHEGSILDDMTKLVAGKDVIFHLAALPRLQRSIAEPWQTHRVNVDGTLNLLLAAKKHKVKRFIFSSSSSVYGDQDRLPFTEDMKPNPLVPYSLQKLIGEEYCQLFSNLWGLGTISLRYFNVYGPKMNPDSPYANLLPKFIKLMSQDKSPTINGDGNQTRDFTYVSDVVEANLLAARSSVKGEVINIGRGENISVNKVVVLLNRLMEKNIQPIHGTPVVEPRASLAGTTKARDLLGWVPKIKFEEGINKFVGA
ncbi:MAG: SDR family oxidoreductase [Candidatus Levybacteria bacterium]|nr:SDR family oxidoreductase [Candidatus Levybacteria bacterium]